jgi:glycerate kinase
MRILIAPNAMKGSVSASDFANAIAEGLLMANDSFELVKRPLADGGDGTLEVLINALNGIFVPVNVHDPLGRMIPARFGWLAESKCAIIEMAEASGIRLLAVSELNPMIATSRGTGELILEAIDRGAKKIILGIGGSATIDGGIGMLKALGFRITDVLGNEVAEGGSGLIRVADIFTDEVNSGLLNCEIVIASDVTNPLLGENGAAEIFGPQKGATVQMIGDLESGLKNYVTVLGQYSEKDLKGIIGGGAAGGIAIPLIAFFNTRIVSGASLILDLTGVFNDLKNCDLVITGEGCIDLQTCQGKGPAVIAVAARQAGIPVIAIGGTIKPEASYLFDGIFSIASGPLSLEEAMKNASELTKTLSFELGKLIKVFKMNEMEISLKAAKKFLIQDMPEKALTILDKLPADNEGEVIFLKGEIYFKLQKWGEALNHFSLFLEQFPSDTKAKSYCIMIQDILGFYHKDLYNP